ncbi:hypothetical protein D3C76_1538130 [compost metagenome]
MADLGFVAVDLRGIDGPVAKLQSSAHRIDDHLVFEPEGAEAEGRDSHRVNSLLRYERRGSVWLP